MIAAFAAEGRRWALGRGAGLLLLQFLAHEECRNALGNCLGELVRVVQRGEERRLGCVGSPVIMLARDQEEAASHVEHRIDRLALERRRLGGLGRHRLVLLLQARDVLLERLGLERVRRRRLLELLRRLRRGLLARARDELVGQLVELLRRRHLREGALREWVRVCSSGTWRRGRQFGAKIRKIIFWG